MHYIGIVEHDGGQYGIVFPDFPGCVSVADTMEEVMVAGRQALELHIDDMDSLPPPSTVEEILAAGEWDIGPTDRFVLVPLLRPIGKSVRVNVSIDKALLEAIDHEAKLRGLTRSAFLVAAALEQVA